MDRFPSRGRLQAASLLMLFSTMVAHAGETPGTTPSMADTTQALHEARALDSLVATAQAALPGSGNEAPVSPPPPSLTVVNGRNTVFPIARHHLNRLTTPFRVPSIKTTSGAEVSSERGGVVYISTDSTEPVSLYITEQGDPDAAISLTLLPREIPPVSVALQLDGYAPRLPAPGDSGDGVTESSYVGTLKSLFQAVARGQIPSGYGLASVPGQHPLMPYCAMAGLSISPVQALTGRNLVVLVARVVNKGRYATEINEQACQSDGLLAVAAWPKVNLAPGEQTELYLAVKRPDPRSASARPRVIAGGAP